MIKVDTKKCPQDHACPMVTRCPKKAITQDGNHAPIVDTTICVECMFCVDNCPYEAFVAE